jgi:hypothetical protein
MDNFNHNPTYVITPMFFWAIFNLEYLKKKLHISKYVMDLP